MKIFKYNPVTGKRGEQIKTDGVISWTDQSVDYQVSKKFIEPIEFNVPNIHGQEWTAHVDAGRGDDSYQTDEWICFCQGQGQWNCGEDAAVWVWIVLPPASAIKKVETA